MGLLHFYFVQLHEDRRPLGNEDSKETDRLGNNKLQRDAQQREAWKINPSANLSETPWHRWKIQAKIAHAKAGFVPFRRSERSFVFSITSVDSGL